MKPVLYEIRKTLTSKPIMALFVLLIVLPVFIALNSASARAPNFNIGSVGYGEGMNGSYNVSVFLYNEYWAPVQGTHVKILNGYTVIASGVSDANGFVNATLQNITDSELSNLSYQYEFTYDGSPSIIDSPITFGSGRANPYFTSSKFSQPSNGHMYNYTIYQPRLGYATLSVPDRPNLQTFGLSYDMYGLGSVPPLYVYYKPMPGVTSQQLGFLQYSNISVGHVTPYESINATYLENESQLTLLGEYQGTPYIPLNTIKLASNSNTTTYLFEIFSSTGIELGYTVVNLSVPYSASQVSSVFNSSELPLLELLVPLMAVLSGFAGFGRGKVDGSLNYVVVRPISRWALISTRYLSIIISIFVPSAISLGISSLVFHFYLGNYIPSDIIFLTLWALFVMDAGYTGIVFFASTVIKSIGLLVGISVGIFLVLDLFWSFLGNIIPSIVTASFTKGSLNYATANVIMNFITPSGFVNLVTYMGLGNTSGLIFLGNFVPAQVGITLFSLIGVGLIWLIVPFTLSAVRFSKFD